jgi:hypothetical protein
VLHEVVRDEHRVHALLGNLASEFSDRGPWSSGVDDDTDLHPRQSMRAATLDSAPMPVEDIEQSDGEYPAAVDLAEEIISVQQAEIDENGLLIR